MIFFPMRFRPIVGTVAMTFALAGYAHSATREVASNVVEIDAAGHSHPTPYRQTGDASWYASKFQGRRTANGERYDAHAMTAAHRTLPLGAYARVTSLATGHSIVVRINDRGPFVRGRVIDLSYAAAAALGLPHTAEKQVRIERLAETDVDVDVQAALDEGLDD